MVLTGLLSLHHACNEEENCDEDVNVNLTGIFKKIYLSLSRSVYKKKKKGTRVISVKT